MVKVRVSEVEIKNVKNVLHGKISFPNSKNRIMEKADVLGIYGQNGSGKTSIVDSFQLLSILLSGRRMNKETDRLIFQGSETASLNFTFLIEINNKMFDLYYYIEITRIKDKPSDFSDLETSQKENSVYVSKEELRYKELLKGSRPKLVIQYLRTDEDYSIGPKSINSKIKSNKDDLYVLFRVNAELAYKESTSFLFRKEGISLFKQILNIDSYELLKALKEIFVKNLFVINNIESNLIQANILIPIHYKRKIPNEKSGYGVILLAGNKPVVITIEKFEVAEKVFQSISKVLSKLVPGLTVELKSLGEQTLPDGGTGIRAELVAIREGRVLPFACESDGIKKLVSILSSLIVMFNDKNACVIIDELDAGIFEFLLGEIVKIVNDSGKGQLLFTSHNLRLLEVLEKGNLVFTSTNPDQRYINLKGIKETNNIRDVYIRAIQLGTEEESVYEVTDRYDIMDAFEEAGGLNNG